MTKCDCRWDCRTHRSWLGRRTINEPGLCTNFSEGKYVRVICPQCDSFQLRPLCDHCWKRVLRWIEDNVMSICEGCGQRNRTKKAWTTFEDVKTP